MPERLSFDDLLARRQALPGDAPVIVTEDGTRIGSAEFAGMVARAAGWLRAQGIGRGDRVALWLPNYPLWLALLFGAARIGAGIAAVNTRYRTAELHHILKSSGARLLIFESRDTHADFHAMIDELDFGDLPDLTALAATDAADLPPVQGIAIGLCDISDSEPVAPEGVSPDERLILFTTSGTTSMPKLVEHPQRSIALHAVNSARAYRFDDPDARLLGAMPLCGVFGLNTVLGAFAGGAPVHLMTAFRLDTAMQMSRDTAFTHFFGSDDMFRMMFEADPGVFGSARVCGFGAFTPGLEGALRRIAEAGVPLSGLYGASEVNAIFSIQPPGMPLGERLKGGGRPSGGADAQVRVRHPETGALLGAGEPGVLEIRAPTNFDGYFRNPEATAKAVDAEGYFRSGDAGYLREDGTFVYLARNGDFLRLSGFLTDPREIEEVIETAAGVAKAQVVGVTLDGRTRPVAFFTAEDGATPEEAAILDHVRPQLAHYKVPARVRRLDAFPTTESPNGLKIQKAKLRTMAQALLKEGQGA